MPDLRLKRGLSLPVGLLLAMIASCVSPGERILSESSAQGFSSGLTPTQSFSLTTAFRPANGTSRRLPIRVYIEGDGRAWLSRTRASNDPSPRNPVALQMSMLDRSGSPVLYVARPCQFEGRADLACTREVWTNGRFSRSVIDSVTEAIEGFRRSAGADSVVLIGYSGGGTVAALVAAQMESVGLLVTVASPLDHELWTRHHAVSRLNGSLQAIDHVDVLSGVPQLHLVGGRDTVVPEAIVDSFMDRLEAGSAARKVVIDEYDHICCWVDDWEEVQALFALSPEP